MSNKMLIFQYFFNITINYNLRLYNLKHALNENENKCFILIFLPGDLMSYVAQIWDLMSGDFMSRDFLTGILVIGL